MISIKKISFTVLVGSALVLSACTNEVEQAKVVVDSASKASTDVVEQINQLTELETHLQEQFVTVFEQDEDLSSLTDETADLFKNINDRDSLLASVSDQQVTLTNLAKDVNKITINSLPEEQITEMKTSLESVASSLEKFNTIYKESLNDQEEFFKSLGQKEASFQTLTDGIKEVQEKDKEVLDMRRTLNNELLTLSHSTQDLKATIESQEKAQEE